MFCPKCGREIKNDAEFCSKCGARIRACNETEKIEQMTDIHKVAPGMIKGKRSEQSDRVQKPALPKIKLDPKFAVAVGVIAVLVLAVSFLMKPKTDDINAQALLEEYFRENTEYSINPETHQKCLEYMVSDLTETLTEKLFNLLTKAGVDIDSSQSRQLSSEIGDALSQYFSNPENQVTLAEEIYKRSSFKVGKPEKNRDVYSAEVTVSSLKISEVNEAMINDSVSIKGLVNLAAQFFFGGKGGIIGNVTNMATGDISFIVDAFEKKVRIVDNHHEYTGTVEFQYDKENERWYISQVDTGLLDAYFGLN